MAEVWRAGEAEVEVVASLLVEFRNWWGRDTPSAADFEAGVRRLTADPDTEYLLGSRAAGEPASGVCQVRFRYGLWYAAQDAWLEDLYVTEAGRGSGVGAALVELAVHRAGKRGAARIELDVNERNANARALYERMGFESEPKAPGGLNLLMGRALSAGD